MGAMGAGGDAAFADDGGSARGEETVRCLPHACWLLSASQGTYLSRVDLKVSFHTLSNVIVLLWC